MIAAAATFAPAPPFADQKVYAIGDVVLDFKLKNVDGRMVSLSDYKNGKGVIIVFTTNHCPFSKAYEERMIALDRKYAPQNFPVIAIQPNDPSAYTEDSFENMKIRAQEKNYSFPYLSDDTQSVAHAFGATRTPEVFVLKRSGDHFTVEYTGAIDDSPQIASGVKRPYVEEAVGNLLVGRPVVLTTTKAIGCAIKWKSI
ncbi:thioredoxin family protein [Larkinella knui]